MKIALHFGVSALRKFSGSVGIDEMAGPAEFFERQPELRERAAIEIARGDELVARLHQREEGEELRRVPRRGRHRRRDRPRALAIRSSSTATVGLVSRE